MTPELHADGTRPASRRPRIVDLIVQRPELATVPLAFVVALLAWHWLTILLHVDPIVFPGPMPVARALVAGLASGAYGHHFWITFKEVLGGFAIGCGAGLVLGAVISQFRILEKTVFPYFVALQTVPKLAIAPLFVVWFGFGLESKIVIGGLISFFPMIVNVIEGLQSTDRRQIDMLRAAGANSWQVFRMVKIPNALPFIFVGLDIGIVLAVLGAIVGEFVGAQGGIGFMILQYNFQLETAKVFALIVVLSVTGIALHNVVRWLHRRTVFWIKPDDVVGA
ncbi:MAG TPA: ABC transporter permease [Casimicrobiaceae bacterium]|jgi:NitT/TauT family transport system permease protein|nr:ABC transporter permease [Casimicrobiaceae bacterium]